MLKRAPLELQGTLRNVFNDNSSLVSRAPKITVVVPSELSVALLSSLSWLGTLIADS
jgi:hypothetical protein